MPEEIDHIDVDTSNNRINNLREATCSENQANKKLKANNTSGFKGVSWDRGKWIAQITINYKIIRLGRYERAEDAHAAYVKAAVEKFGEYHRVG